MSKAKPVRSRANTRLIAFCGLYCADCPKFQPRMANLAQDLKQEIEDAGLVRINRSRPARSKGRREFEIFWRLLDTVAGFECAGCRETGCSITCRIRKCCPERKLAGCWECAEMSVCPDLARLRQVHGKGLDYNLKMLQRKGPREFLSGPRYWLGRPVRT